MSTNAFAELVREENRREEQAEISRDERDRMNGIVREGARTDYLATNHSWGLDHVTEMARARVGVHRYADLLSDRIIFGVSSGCFSLQENLTAAQARRLAKALLLAADDVEAA